MECSSRKIYGFDEVDAKGHYERYFSPHVPHSIYKDSTIYMIQAIYNAFKTGLVKGRTAIDFSIGPIIVSLIGLKDFVQEITVLELNDACLKEIEKWKNKDADAINWSHTMEVLQGLKENSDGLEEEEEDLRRKIKSIMKWDVSKDNPADSLCLPKADIVTSIWGLETMSRNHEEYRRNLRKLSDLINPGGYLLVQAVTNSSYFSAGETQIHFLNCDESFYKKVISEEGFEIKHVKIFDRPSCVHTADHIDHEGQVFIIAQKMN